MKRIFIKNRKGQKISVIIEESNESKGLVFVMHGLGGNKEQPHIKVIAKVFEKNKYTVVRFDTTNTFGESEGNYEDATITNYYEDLEDVINWSKTQTWYKEPFILAGHSLGSICAALYAENYSDKIKALAPLSTVVSGRLSFQAPKHSKEELEGWKKTRLLTWRSSSNPTLIKKLKWSHMEDRLKYDLLNKVDKLTMPVLMIVGENDNSTPIKHQRILYDKLPGEKELHIIKDCEHTFRREDHLEQLKKIFNNWIKKLK